MTFLYVTGVIGVIDNEYINHDDNTVSSDDDNTVSSDDDNTNSVSSDVDNTDSSDDDNTPLFDKHINLFVEKGIFSEFIPKKNSLLLRRMKPKLRSPTFFESE